MVKMMGCCKWVHLRNSASVWCVMEERVVEAGVLMSFGASARATGA